MLEFFTLSTLQYHLQRDKPKTANYLVSHLYRGEIGWDPELTSVEPLVKSEDRLSCFHEEPQSDFSPQGKTQSMCL